MIHLMDDPSKADVGALCGATGWPISLSHDPADVDCPKCLSMNVPRKLMRYKISLITWIAFKILMAVRTVKRFSPRRRGQIEGEMESEIWVCNYCGNIEVIKQEVYCWKCGKGEMIYHKGRISFEAKLEAEKNQSFNHKKGD